MTPDRLFGGARGAWRWIAAYCRQLAPARLYGRHRLTGARRDAEQVLASFAVRGAGAFEGCVLVDAMWDNPNYWIRYTLLRSALGLSRGREVGVLGPHRAKICRQTLERFGISQIVHVTALRGDAERNRRQARDLLACIKAPADILSWRLPHDLPADFVYDGIIKRQQSACVDLKDPHLPQYVAEALGSIAAAYRILESYPFDLVVLSHEVNFQGAALAWLAAQKGVPVVIAFGNYGVARFAKLAKPADIYDTADRPKGPDLIDLPTAKAEMLAAVGSAYVKKRLDGGTDDMGARLAFQKAGELVSRASLAKKFCWDPQRSVIAVYAHNWFDFPRSNGMTHFRDFLDWIEATLAVAVGCRSANWLFKAHPGDQWYGGVTLSDLVPPLDRHPHVRLVPTNWNGSAMLDAVDAVVTYHGTVGIEAASLGKPVLIADRGWYHDAGFAKWSRSREEYLDALATNWWKDLDLSVTTHRARVFAGWYFGRPAWQGGFVLEDDTVQWPIYRTVPGLFAGNPEVLEKETQTIREWFRSDSRHYHTFKMRRADEYSYS